jgi:hypothetical protein
LYFPGKFDFAKRCLAACCGFVLLFTLVFGRNGYKSWFAGYSAYYYLCRSILPGGCYHDRYQSSYFAAAAATRERMGIDRALWERLTPTTILCLVICMSGVLIAAWPLLENSTATPAGLLILMAGMIVYSIGVLYFSRVEWNGLPLLAINGWQVLLGGEYIYGGADHRLHPRGDGAGDRGDLLAEQEEIKLFTS